MSNTEKFVSDLIEDIETNRLVLPTLPEVALRVRDAVDDPNSSASKIASIVVSDAALSGRLIQVVNSPLYRGRSPITDIQMAVSRMGMTVVRSLVTSLVMQQIYQPTVEELDKRLREIWENSTTVAALSNALAKEYTRLKPDEAMLAGLIHNIGALPILMRAEEDEHLCHDIIALDAIIEEMHPQIGKIILESWDFPAQMVAVAAEHENYSRDSENGPDYTDVVQVANLQNFIGTRHPLAELDWATVPAFAKLGIDTTVEEISVEGVSEEALNEVAGLLNA